MNFYKGLKNRAKKRVREEADLIFDQWGVDISQVAIEPVRTIKGERVITDTQLKFITDASQPIKQTQTPLQGVDDELHSYSEKIAEATRLMENIPTSLLVESESGAEETVQIDKEGIYFEMSFTKTAAADAETVVEDNLTAGTTAKETLHPLLEMREDVVGRKGNSIQFGKYENRLQFVHQKIIYIPAPWDQWQALSQEKWEDALFALGVTEQEEVYNNRDLCLLEKKNRKRMSGRWYREPITHPLNPCRGRRCQEQVC